MNPLQQPQNSLSQQKSFFPSLIIPTFLLIFSHLFTNFIQFDAPLAQMYLNRFCRAFSLGFWGLAAFILCTLISIGYAACFCQNRWFHLKTLFSQLSSNFKLRGVFILISIFIPQRLMDNNSGYTLIRRDSELGILLLGLDIFRSFCVLWLFQDIIRPISCSKIQPRQIRKRFNLTGLIVFSACSMAILALVFQHFALLNIPHVQDEIVQDWEARLLAEGKWPGSPDSCWQSFRIPLLGVNRNQLFSTYQPGLSLIWSVFMQIGRVDIVNPLFALISIFYFYKLVSTNYMGPTVKIACLLFATSPFLAIMASGRMNHLFVLTLLLFLVRGITLAPGKLWLRGALIAGLSCGLAIMTRRVDGIIMSVAALIALIIGEKPDRKLWLFLFIAFLVLSLIVYVQICFSKTRSGDLLNMIRQSETLVNDLSTLPIGMYLSNLCDNLLGLNVFAFGGIITGLMGFGFLRLRATGIQGLIERFFVIHTIFLLIAYHLYLFQDFCYGPRFLFCILPAAALAAGRMLEALATVIPNRNIQKLIFVACCFSVFVTINQGWSNLANHFWHIDPAFENFVKENVQSPALLFIRNATRMRIEIARTLKTKGFSLEEIQKFVESDHLNYEGLENEIQNLDVSEKIRIEKILRQYQENSQFNKSEYFDINEAEVVRLNSGDSLSQQIVFALDLGDVPNQALIKKLPMHKPFLVSRNFQKFNLNQFYEIGVEYFNP